jgi:hypothetical protein
MISFCFSLSVYEDWKAPPELKKLQPAVVLRPIKNNDQASLDRCKHVLDTEIN